jgi:hypothetical protein
MKDEERGLKFMLSLLQKYPLTTQLDQNPLNSMLGFQYTFSEGQVWWLPLASFCQVRYMEVYMKVKQWLPVGFEVFTTVVMKKIIFCDMMPCSPWRKKFSKKPASKQVVSLPPACLLNLFLRPWRWRWHVPPKRRLTLNGLRGVISQRVILFSDYLLPVHKIRTQPVKCAQIIE